MKRRFGVVAVFAVLVATAVLLFGGRLDDPDEQGAEPGGEVSREATSGRRPPALEARSVAGAPAGESAAVVAVTGRAVDDRRFGVSGAVATLHRLGDPVHATTSGADGRFRIDGVDRPPSGASTSWFLRVRSTDGRVGSAPVS